MYTQKLQCVAAMIYTVCYVYYMHIHI